MTQVLCFDPITSDQQSKVRGVGRYLQILKENFPDWIFSNKLQVESYKLQVFLNPFFNFLQKPVTLKRIAKKQIAVIHDLIPLKYPSKFPAGIRGNFNIFLNKLALKNYDLIVTDSQASKKDIIQILKIPEEKVRVIYPCLPQIFNKKLKTQNSKLKIATQNFKTEKNNNKFLDLSYSFDICDLSFELDNFCLYVGDATWNKNLVNLARAIKIANVTCVLVGKVFRINSPSESEGSPKSAKSEKSEKLKISDESRILLDSSGLSDLTHPWQKQLNEFFKLTKDDKRFIFLGFIDDYRLIKLYQQAKVNLLLSYDEGFGLSYLEAASQGCPSVLSNIPVLKEISAGNALLADPENPNDLADKILRIYSDDNLRKNLSLGALKQAKIYSESNFRKSFSSIIYE
jgi:glycosyltransferase involved in cell wall biosynthesis